jgi:hypothetical protein
MDSRIIRGTPRFSVRVRGENGKPGSHDTVWDDVEFRNNGWLVCMNYRAATPEEQEAWRLDGGHGPLYVVGQEHWYPPISIYSVKRLED